MFVEKKPNDEKQVAMGFCTNGRALAFPVSHDYCVSSHVRYFTEASAGIYLLKQGSARESCQAAFK